ncbi:MAG: beta strand repeat-containing protein, partial [Planctomycetota bacterium]
DLQYVWSSAESLVGVEFSGLATGPQTVEQGRYSNLLFATSLTGSLYAFDPAGALAPIFLDGETSVQLLQNELGTPLFNATGLDFSPIDYNLWHTTNYRRDDAGHGVEEALDGSRLGRTSGGTSFYFGFEDPRPNTTITYQPGASNYVSSNPGVFYSYDLPGGAHGSLTTDPFSLEGYDSADEPMLYFNYFLEKGGPQNFDIARLYISDDGATWQPLTSTTRGLGDTGGDWLQAQIDLSAYAGLDNLKLRFDFASAGEMHVGDENNFYAPDAEFLTGAYLRALAGAELNDGETFMVDYDPWGFPPNPGQTFEFDLGYELVVPNAAGAAIQDDPILGGESFSIEDQTGQIVVFEFDKDATLVVGDVAIPISDTDTTFKVATAIGSAIAGSGLSGVTAYVNDTKVTVQGTANVTQSAGAAVILQGDNGVAPTSVPVPLAPNMTADQVAVAIAGAMDHYYSGLRQFQAVDGATLANAQQFTATLDTAVDALNDGTGLVAPLGTVATTVGVASASIAPTGLNTDFTIRSPVPGPGLENIDVVFVNDTAAGDQAIVALDVVAGTLTIDVDPTATTANTVVAAINAEGTFTAALDTTADPTNDGSGLIVNVGSLATTALFASAGVPLAGDNNDLSIDAVTPNPILENVDVIFVHNPGIGDAAVATFSGVTLSIEIDPFATTAGTVMAEINSQGIFACTLDTTADPTNDGSGLIIPLGNVATMAGVASATITPTGFNTDFTIRSAIPGSGLDNVDVVFVNNMATGDQAVVVLDVVAGTLTIDVDPTATTASTVVAEINAEGSFTAALDTTADPTNDGSGLITDVGSLATTSLGVVSAGVALAGENNDLTIFAVTPDPVLDGVAIIFVNNAAVGDQALVAYDAMAGTLTIDFDPTATTVNTVRAAIGAEGTFSVSDGSATFVFEFENTALGDGVTAGNIPLLYDPASTANNVAATVVAAFDAQNSATATIALTGDNNDLLITAAAPGLALDNTDILLVSSFATGDQALVTYDPVSSTLTIDIDPAATTANTVMTQINFEGTFTAALDSTLDPNNDGSGLISPLGAVATTSGDASLASTTLTPPGDNNDLAITAANPGVAW